MKHSQPGRRKGRGKTICMPYLYHECNIINYRKERGSAAGVHVDMMLRGRTGLRSKAALLNPNPTNSLTFAPKSAPRQTQKPIQAPCLMNYIVSHSESRLLRTRHLGRCRTPNPPIQFPAKLQLYGHPRDAVHDCSIPSILDPESKVVTTNPPPHPPSGLSRPRRRHPPRWISDSCARPTSR